MIFAMSPQPLNLRLLGGTREPSNPEKNTLWVKTSTAIPSWDFSAKQPARRSKNKNLFVYPYYSGASLTSNGVSFSCNSSGHVTANGTASEAAYYRILRPTDNFWLEPGTYTLSGCPAQPSSGTAYVLYLWDSIADTGLAYDYGAGKTFTLTKRTQISASIQVSSGKTASAALFKPQLEKASAATSFVKGDATGQLWIKTVGSVSASIDVLKKNGLRLDLCGAKQYLNGAWKDADAVVSQDGAWVDIVNDLIIFDSSSTEDGFALVTSLSGYGSASISAGKISLSGQYVSSAADNAVALYYKKEKVSTSGFTNAHVTIDSALDTVGGSAFGSTSKAKLVLQSAPTADIAAANAAEVSITGTGTFTVPLPSGSGSYYVGLMVNARAAITASKIWLD